MVLHLVNHLALIVTAGIVIGFIDVRWIVGALAKNAWQGITFGLVAVLAILTPCELATGFFVEGSSVVLSIGTLLFGPVVGIVSGVVAILARMIVGGSGAWPSMAVIVSSVTIGILGHTATRRQRLRINEGFLYVFGIVVHCVMLMVCIFIPSTISQAALQVMALPVLIIFPAATVLIGTIIQNRNHHVALFKDMEENEKKYRTLVSHSSTALFIFNPDETYRFVNEAFAKSFGMTQEEIIGKTPHAILPYDEAEKRLAIVRQVFRTGTSGEITGRVDSPTGEERYFHTIAEAIQDDIGNTVWVSCYSRDVTENRRAEDALKESQRKYQTIFENVQDVYYEATLDGTIIEVSPSIELLSKGLYRREELIGKSMNDIYANADERRALLNVLRKHGGVSDHEITLQNCDGSIVVCSVSARIRYSAREGTGLIVGSLRDISERKQAEENLRRMGERLRQSEKMDAIGQLAGGIAHDFNNVLGGIIGFTDMTLALTEKGSLLEKNLLKILKASDRATHLVKQILTFSRQGNPQLSVVVLRPLLKEVLDMLRAAIPSSVAIDAQLCADTKPILADAVKIHEAILNLAMNAVHAMNRKGTVSVRLYGVQCESTMDGRIGEIVPGEYTVIEISDNGCGMSAQTLSRAFEPFFTTKSVGEGTGMGLSVVLGVVRSAGGDIVIDSEVGKGTTVRLYFPVTEELPSVPNASIGCSNSVGKEHVLFVDDERMLVELNVEGLTALGYSVTGMSDSLEALKFIRDNASDIDILITDQTMPGITGLELVKEALNMKCDFPIILCTGYSSDLENVNLMVNGIKKMLIKPYHTHEIGESIRQLLDAKKATVSQQ